MIHRLLLIEDEGVSHFDPPRQEKRGHAATIMSPKGGLAGP
jgi:hypothetical protein